MQKRFQIKDSEVFFIRMTKNQFSVKNRVFPTFFKKSKTIPVFSTHFDQLEIENRYFNALTTSRPISALDSPFGAPIRHPAYPLIKFAYSEVRIS